MGTGDISFVCTAATFVPHPHPAVRWLDPRRDFALARAAWAARGLALARAEWDEWHADGYRYCALIEDGRVVALAAAWAYSPTAWELAAVWTRADCRGRGCATAVSSFITAHILDQGRIATCHTRSANHPMRRVATRLGFRQRDAPRAG